MKYHNWEKYKKMICKYANSYSYKAGWLNTRKDIYQELILTTLNCLEKRGNMTESEFLNFLSTALKNRKSDFIQHELTKDFYRSTFKNDLQTYSKLPTSHINLNIILPKIEEDINNYHYPSGRPLQFHIKEQLCEIIRFHLLYGNPRRDSHIELRINRNTLKKRYKILREIFSKYYDFEYLKKFSDFTETQKKEVWKDLQIMRIDDVARKWNIKRTALAHWITEMNKKKKRNRGYGSYRCRPFVNEIKALIKKYSDLRPYSKIASQVKNDLEDFFGYRETYGRIYHIVLRELC